MEKETKILLINFGGIGDEILFLPTISTIKKEFKNSKIFIGLEPRSKSIQNLCEYINQTIAVDIKVNGYKKYLNIIKFIIKCRKEKFDIVVSSGKSPFIAVILWLIGAKERIGYSSKTDFLLTKHVDLNENQYAGKMYHDLISPLSNIEYENPKINVPQNYPLDSIFEPRKYIVIHPGVSKMSLSKGIYKCPDVTFWRNLIEGLLLKNKKIVLLGTQDDEDLIKEILSFENISSNPNFINYYKKTKNIMDMANIMKNSESVICVDSAPLHVAVSVNARVYAIFGPTNDLKLVPKEDRISVIKNNIECRPCLWHKRTKNCLDSNCLKINFEEIINRIK